MRPVTNPPASDALSLLSPVAEGIERFTPCAPGNEEKLSHPHRSAVESINHGS